MYKMVWLCIESCDGSCDNAASGKLTTELWSQLRNLVLVTISIAWELTSLLPSQPSNQINSIKEICSLFFSFLFFFFLSFFLSLSLSLSLLIHQCWTSSRWTSSRWISHYLLLFIASFHLLHGSLFLFFSFFTFHHILFTSKSLN